MKLNLTEEARQEFVKAGLKGAKKTLKSQGKEHYKKMAQQKWKNWKEKKEFEKTMVDNFGTTIK